MNIRKKLIASSIILTITTSLLTGCSQSLNNNTSTNTTKTAYNGLFKQNEIMDVKIEIKEDDLKDIKENAMDEKYHSANITV